MNAVVYLDHHNHVLLVAKICTTYAYAVALRNTAVSVIKVRKIDLATMRPATYHGAPYPIKRAVRNFRDIGKRLAITKSAARILRAANTGEQNDIPNSRTGSYKIPHRAY